MTTKRCFPPVVDAHTRVLVLGSLPGEVSLAQAQYYAHKQNRFWHLMGDVLDVDLVSLPYESRLSTLLEHRVGLWDVVAEARRDGSLDSSIRDHQGNDLPGLIATLPQLRAIAFNGGTAAKIGEKALAGQGDRHAILRLPSSSPAYTLAYAEKLVKWQAVREWVG
ncbi:DNA-deoxyinosine glycosylase [Cupriavidus agavae]|uniref:G/U mismatch-specific uracil-DNA glycosylase n=1 Tax=Cupriavidus agavae TaxID=1001822 RepID=A0A4Q7S6S5_9BURK|nr:DNA-deoxyinosine glycosylase [Cupriavidus agavae]RZT41567.1 G/U mismatch-specific uracil-DNA glycosylase [Cupriavidus agavae]